MEMKIKKIRLLAGLLSLLRIRQDEVKDPIQLICNENFSYKIKTQFYRIDRDFLEFIYCYMFNHFTKLLKANIYLNDDCSVSIKTMDENDIESKYQSDTYEKIEDRAIPIKRTRKTVVIDEDEHVRLSNEVTYFNSKSIEMAKLMSKEETCTDTDLSIDELLQKAESLPRNIVLFRVESNLTEVMEISKSNGRPYGVKRHNNDLNCIWDINPKDDGPSTSNSDFEVDYKVVMPSIVSNYLQDLKNKNINEKYINEKPKDPYDKTLIDDDILNMVEKIEMNYDEPISGEEYIPNKFR